MIRIDGASDKIVNTKSIFTGADNFAGGWSGYQYFSDSHFDSGADTYICTKDCGSIYWIDGMWFVDSESAVGICDDLMVELQYLSWIGLTYGAVFIFIGKF